VDEGEKAAMIDAALPAGAVRVLVLLAQRSEWVLIAEIDARATELGDDDAAFVPALVARGFVLHRVGAKAIKISMEGWRYLHRHPPAPPDRASPPRRN
jgi:hypothetical protein